MCLPFFFGLWLGIKLSTSLRKESHQLFVASYKVCMLLSIQTVAWFIKSLPEVIHELALLHVFSLYGKSFAVMYKPTCVQTRFGVTSSAGAVHFCHNHCQQAEPISAMCASGARPVVELSRHNELFTRAHSSRFATCKDLIAI